MIRGGAIRAIGMLFGAIVILQMVSGLGSSQDVIRVGFYENEPKLFTDVGVKTGFYYDLTEYIAREEGWTLEYVDCHWSECLDMVANGQIDIMPDVAYSTNRSNSMLFTNISVMTDSSAIYVRKEESLSTFSNLAGKRVGVLNNSINYVGANGIKALVEIHQINVVFIEYDSYTLAFEGANNNDVDYVVTNRWFGRRFMDEYSLIQSELIFSPYSLHYTFPLDAWAIRDSIDIQLVKLMGDIDSEYYSLMNNYLSPSIIHEHHYHYTIPLYPEFDT